jgi:hypothetical protein
MAFAIDDFGGGVNIQELKASNEATNVGFGEAVSLFYNDAAADFSWKMAIGSQRRGPAGRSICMSLPFSA